MEGLRKRIGEQSHLDDANGKNNPESSSVKTGPNNPQQERNSQKV